VPNAFAYLLLPFYDILTCLRFLTGQSQFLTTPVAAKPLSFSLALDDHLHDSEHELRNRDIEDSDARLMEMLAAQAAHREVDSLGADEESIAANGKLSPEEKRDTLQKSLNMAASNGDVERVRKLVQGSAKEFIDVNMPDEEGTVPLIYASCFVSSPMSLYLARTIVPTQGCPKFQLRRSFF